MLAVVLLIVLFISGWIRRPLSRMVEQMKAKETVPPSGAEELRFVSETYKHITFYGWVQGVGFRYRARHAAELYGCTQLGEERMGRQRHHGDPRGRREHRSRDPGDWGWKVCKDREHGQSDDSGGHGRTRI